MLVVTRILLIVKRFSKKKKKIDTFSTPFISTTIIIKLLHNECHFILK